jgi:hypothetical protein
MAINGSELVLMIGDKIIAKSKGCDLVIPLDMQINKDSKGWDSKIKNCKEWSMIYEPPIKHGFFKYYYHRGNKWYFKNYKGKMIIEGNLNDGIKNIGIKYYDTVFMEWE